MIPAQELRERVTFERFTSAADGYGEEVGTWGELTKRWAKAVFGSGREAREAAQTSATAPGTFYVRGDSVTRTVTPADRLVAMGATWNILSVEPIDMRGDDLRVTAVRAA